MKQMMSLMKMLLKKNCLFTEGIPSLPSAAAMTTKASKKANNISKALFMKYTVVVDFKTQR